MRITLALMMRSGGSIRLAAFLLSSLMFRVITGDNCGAPERLAHVANGTGPVC